MQIINSSKNTTLSKNATFAKSKIAKSKGLIGSKSESIIIKTRFGIHTFLLKSSIDVLILDKGDKVVALKENLKPNKIFLWPIKYNKIIELKRGKIAKTKTALGDIITF